MLVASSPLFRGSAYVSLEFSGIPLHLYSESQISVYFIPEWSSFSSLSRHSNALYRRKPQLETKRPSLCQPVNNSALWSRTSHFISIWFIHLKNYSGQTRLFLEFLSGITCYDFIKCINNGATMKKETLLFPVFWKTVWSESLTAVYLLPSRS